MKNQSLENTWYALRALDPQAAGAAQTEAELFIYDEIGGWGVHANELLAELKALPESVDTLHLRINSPGGSVIQGNVIYNALKRLDKTIITHIDGMAASMASVIALAGSRVHMAANALYMIHNPWTMIAGEADDLRKEADLLDKIKDTILNAYDRANYDRAELGELMDAETWFTATEAWEAGFIDEIEGEQKAAAKALDFKLVEKFNLPADYALSANKREATIQDEYEAEYVKTLESEHKGALEQLEENAVEISRLSALVKQQEAELEQKENDFLLKEKAFEKSLAEAREIKDVEVSAKVAEQMAALGAPAAQTSDSTEAKTDSSPDAIRAEYAQIKQQYPAGHPTRAAFYAEHKTTLGA